MLIEDSTQSPLFGKLTNITKNKQVPIIKEDIKHNIPFCFQDKYSHIQFCKIYMT